MERPTLLLVDVAEPYQSAFRAWSARQGAALVVAEGELPVFAAAVRLCLAVLGAPAADETPAAVRALRKLHGHVPLVVLSGSCRISTVVELVRAGVADVIELPAPPVDVVERAVLHARESALEAGPECLVGRSPAMQTLRREIEAVAPLNSTVLLCGETGTGKGLVARLIHDLSSRAREPFVHVDCATLAPSVIESELFGHERGSFTGALRDRPGRFELAADGSIFLDEIGELGLDLQAKLLRVLQDRTYERLGGRATRFTAARIIAATNRDLARGMKTGSFRADLFYRLNVFRIELPPLRAHLEDVSALARAGLEAIAARLQVSVPTLSDSFHARLRAYAWPGNVRELMNVLERLVIHHHAGWLDETDLDGILPETPATELAGEPSTDGLGPGVPGEDERAVLEAELLAAGGNVSRVARRLRIARSTLRYRIRMHGLQSLIPKD
jgi:DNA-binding NtrC family response regulator